MILSGLGDPAKSAGKFQEFAREAGAVVVGNSVADAQANYNRYFDVIKKVVQGTGVVID